MEKLLPQLSKTSKFSSFVRQLNIYNFKKKKRRTYIEYTNGFFQRDRKEYLSRIERKSSDCRSNYTSDSSSDITPDRLEEIKENNKLQINLNRSNLEKKKELGEELRRLREELQHEREKEVAEHRELLRLLLTLMAGHCRRIKDYYIRKLKELGVDGRTVFLKRRISKNERIDLIIDHIKYTSRELVIQYLKDAISEIKQITINNESKVYKDEEILYYLTREKKDPGNKREGFRLIELKPDENNSIISNKIDIVN